MKKNKAAQRCDRMSACGHLEDVGLWIGAGEVLLVGACVQLEQRP